MLVPCNFNEVSKLVSAGDVILVHCVPINDMIYYNLHIKLTNVNFSLYFISYMYVTASTILNS